MNRETCRRCVLVTAIVLAALMLMGFLPRPKAHAAGKESPNVLKASRQHLVAAYGKLPLSFQGNTGQSNNEVKFISRGPGYTLFLTRRAEALLALSAAARRTYR